MTEVEATADSIAAEMLAAEADAMDGGEDTNTTEQDNTDDSTFVDGEDSLFNSDDGESKEAIEGELIAGRFKTQDDLVADWKKQNDVIKGRIKNMPEDDLRAIAQEKGWIQEVPESYELEDAMKDASITPFNREEYGDEYDALNNQLREGKFTNKQVKLGFQLMAPFIEKEVARLGPKVDKEAQMDTLRGEWGDKFEERGKAVAKWAHNNISSELFYKPLSSTSEGFKLLEQMMKSAKGAQPITQGGRSSSSYDPIEMDKKEREIMTSDAYQNPQHPDHQATHTKLEQMIKQRQKMRN